MPTQRKKLFRYDELPDPSSKGIIITYKNVEKNIIVVKKNKRIFIYKNSCPHTLSPLDWTPNNFLNEDNSYIMCANHGALFQIEDGLCIYGPCQKQSLHALDFVIDNGVIFLLD